MASYGVIYRHCDDYRLIQSTTSSSAFTRHQWVHYLSKCLKKKYLWNGRLVPYKYQQDFTTNISIMINTLLACDVDRPVKIYCMQKGRNMQICWHLFSLNNDTTATCKGNIHESFLSRLAGVLAQQLHYSSERTDTVTPRLLFSNFTLFAVQISDRQLVLSMWFIVYTP